MPDANHEFPVKSGHSRQTAAALVAAVMLAAFIGMLLVDNYLSRVRRVELALVKHSEPANHLARGLSYFFYERTKDIRALCESSQVKSYFENEALGMSLEYGLQFNLNQVKRLLTREVAESRVLGVRIYDRVVFLDAHGAMLVESALCPEAARGQIALSKPLKEGGICRLLPQGAARPHLAVVQPFFFKGRQRGQMVMLLNHAAVEAQLRGEKPRDGHGQDVYVTQDDGFVIASSCKEGGNDARPLSAVPWLDLPHGIPKRVLINDSAGKSVEYMGFRAPVKGTPLTLVSFARLDQIVHGLAPWQMLAGMAALSAGVLAIAFVIVKNATKYAVLSARYEESQSRHKEALRHNEALEKEIQQRTRAEQAMRSAKDEAEAASQAKSEFLATISHEIRTPMNAIIGLTDVVLFDELPDHQREYLGVIRKSSRRLLMVINDLLDFSKLDAGKLNVENTPFELRNCVAAVKTEIQVQAEQKGLRLLVHMEDDVPEMVSGDEARVHQILLNLVGNAIKFTDHGAVSIELSLVERVAGRIQVHFQVRDTGIGIPAEKQAHIFDAFVQADNFTTRRFGGTGLGLAICARLIQMMGGRIWVESEEGAGSAFHFTVSFGLPRNASEAVHAAGRGMDGRQHGDES